MPHTNIGNSDDIIDSRDVIARIEELREERETLREAVDEAEDRPVESDADPDSNPEENRSLRQQRDDAAAAWDDWESDYGDELKALESLAEEAEGYAPDWRYGATLIREDYFEEYCEELLDDIGDLPHNLPGYLVIDWEATARNLRMDYTEVEYAGVTYLIR